MTRATAQRALDAATSLVLEGDQAGAIRVLADALRANSAPVASLSERLAEVRARDPKVYPLASGYWHAWVEIGGRTWGAIGPDPTGAMHSAIDGYHASVAAVADGMPW